MERHEVIRATKAQGIMRMRAALRFKARDLGWATMDNPPRFSAEEWKKATTALNDWFMNNGHSPVRKAVDDMTHSELRKAVTVLSKLVSNRFKQIAKHAKNQIL